MARWTDKSFKMSTGEDKPVKGSFSAIGSAMSQDGKYSKKEDPAKQMLQHLYNYLEKPQVVKERSIHRVPGLHASSLHSTCARREIIIEIAMTVSKKKMVIQEECQKAGSTFTQDLGHALHDWWQNNYLGEAGLLYGPWKCSGCLAAIEGLKPSTCASCGKKGGFRYQEMSVHVKDGLDIHGHTDGIVVDIPGMASSKHRILEIKTKSPSQYPTIHGPASQHVIQVHTYMKGLGLDEAIIIYIAKGKQCAWTVRNGMFKAGAPRVKGFLVPFDHELWAGIEKRVVEYHEAQRRITAVKKGEAKAEDVLNPKEFTRICSDIKCSMARKCAVKDVCFSV